MIRLYFVSLILIFTTACVQNIESGQEVLFKKDYSKKIRDYQSFPMSSWSYIVTKPDFKFSKEELNLIEESFPVILDKDQPRGMGILLEDWILDGVFLERPPEALDKKLKGAVTKGQFLEMFNPGGLKYIQNDPFGRSEKFMGVWSENFHLNKNKVEGETGEEAKYKFTPVLSRSLDGEKKEINWDKLEAFLAKGAMGHIIGAEFFAKENKAVIMKDLRFVAIVGSIFGLVLIGLILYLSLYKVLFFIPVIGLAMWCATWVLASLMGSVHGLVLSFGTSIVGLSLDYAIHAIHAKDKKRLWYKNALALGTTLLAFGCLSFSTVPLFRGIALFAILGLSLSFLLMWSFDQKFKFYQNGFSLNSPFAGMSNKWVYSIFLVVLLLFTIIKYNESLKPFMYTPESVAGIMDEMGKSKSEVLVKLSPVDETLDLDIGVKPFNLQSFTGNMNSEKARLNGEGWRKAFGAYDVKSYNGFFKPFIESSLAQVKKGFVLEDKFYASLFMSKNQQIHFLNLKDKKLIKEAKASGFWSPSKTVDEMGGETLKELLKLFGVALVLAFCGLWFLMKSFSKVVKVFFPFTLSLAMFFSLSLILGFQINLVHIIGLLIVFGISLDYGVFGAESNEDEKTETMSAFALSALSTGLGFAPLVLARHPVLQSLGVVLVVGILSSFVGGLVLLGRKEVVS